VDFVTEMWKNEVTLGYLFALTGHGRPRAMARRDRTARTISTSHRTSRSEPDRPNRAGKCPAPNTFPLVPNPKVTLGYLFALTGLGAGRA
jgi:hypothetical protein